MRTCVSVRECVRVCVCKRATLESENRVQLQIRVRFQFASLELGAAAESESQTWVPATVAAVCLRPASVQYTVPVVDLSIRHKRTYIPHPISRRQG